MKTHNELENIRDIIERIRAGDTEAYGFVYDAYVEPIYRFIFFKVATKEVAQDLTSEVFLKVFHYIQSKERQIDHLRALLYTTARNSVIDHYRQEGRIEIEDNEEAQENLVGIKTEDVEELLDTKLTVERIELVIGSLKQEWRDVVILRFVEDYSHKEIAQMLGKKEGAIRVALHRALTEIRKQLGTTD